MANRLRAEGFLGSPLQVRLNEVDCLPLNEQGRQLLAKCSPYESLAATNLACALLTVPDIDASMQEVMESTRHEFFSFVSKESGAVQKKSGTRRYHSPRKPHGALRSVSTGALSPP